MMRKQRSSQWIPVFPSQSAVWKHIATIADAAMVYRRMLELQPTTSLRALSICSGVIDESRVWRFYTADEIHAFYTHMLRNNGTIKVRVEAQRRHHMFTRMLP